MAWNLLRKHSRAGGLTGIGSFVYAGAGGPTAVVCGSWLLGVLFCAV